MAENGTSGSITVPMQIGFATSMSIAFLVDIFGNGLVLAAILKDPKLQTTSNYYIFALAVTDVSIGMINY